MTEQIVTPWKVEGNIDYNKLVKQFGTELIDQKLIDRFENVIGKPVHPWIKRGIFFSHRELNGLLNAYEKDKDSVYLYTGRSSTSESMHTGHLIPFIMTKWLQDVLDCPLVIQMGDDEKYYFKDMEFNELYRLGFENAKDIIAFGFNPKKTFIFSNRDYRTKQCIGYEVLASDMKKVVSARTVAKVFGFGEKVEVKIGNETVVDTYSLKEDVNVGMFDWAFYQSAASFSEAFPHIFSDKRRYCLVVYAIDQDNYFRLARDIADKMKLYKPCSIMSNFLPPLTGSSGKMNSSSGIEASIFLTDDAKTIREKVIKNAFSGGRQTLKEHRQFGGDVLIDIPCQYLKYFEYDDKKLEEYHSKFAKGELTSTEIKNILADKLAEIIIKHQEERKKVTKEILEDFYSMKKLF